MKRCSLVVLFTLAHTGCKCSDEEEGLRPTDGSVFEATDSGPGSICAPEGERCARDTTSCCSGVCSPEGLCTQATFCSPPGISCASSLECCTLSCEGGRCGARLCLATGQVCGRGDECCSTICGAGGVCEPVPAGPANDTCKTLGEGCASSGECCSTNCQGGACVRAYSCQTNGDVCRSNEECCGNVCSAPADAVGRCQFITGAGGGGCIQGGNVCPNGGTNCCSRICVDLGTGAPVCQIAGGCRLTGEFCTSDDGCCGGGINPNGDVDCRTAPAGRCDNGQSCNPVGNICGAPVLPSGGGINASQNCCEGKKEVCKLDSSGIPRCFGGCPNDICPADCPTGYDPMNPNCCITSGGTCQFRDQCCNFAPCVPNPSGGFVCGAAPDCAVVGAPCNPAGDPGSEPCCPGTECLASGGGGFACRAPAPSADAGLGDGDGGPFDGGPLPDAAPACSANGAPCSSGGDCCSGICTTGSCRAPSACQPELSPCSASADCCGGLSCDIPGGATSGTCRPGATCGNIGQACTLEQSCCAPLACNRLGGPSACDGTTACVCVISL